MEVALWPSTRWIKAAMCKDPGQRWLTKALPLCLIVRFAELSKLQALARFLDLEGWNENLIRDGNVAVA